MVRGCSRQRWRTPSERVSGSNKSVSLREDGVALQWNRTLVETSTRLPEATPQNGITNRSERVFRLSGSKQKDLAWDRAAGASEGAIHTKTRTHNTWKAKKPHLSIGKTDGGDERLKAARIWVRFPRIPLNNFSLKSKNMSKLMFSALLIMAVGIILWAVAILAQLTGGNPDGWVDAGTIVGLLGFVPLYIDQKSEERRAK